MPKFNYVALDARGQESVGMIEAPSTNDAVGQLRQSGYFPTSVVEEGKGAPLVKAKKKKDKAAVPAKAATKRRGGGNIFVKKTVKTKTLMIFTRQLATLIDAGLPLLRGLTVLAKQERDIVLKSTINQLADSVQGGSTFSESLAQHPRIFNKLYINMVKAGELGGVLELVLNRLAEFQEKAQKIKNKVVAAMFYPVIVLVIAIGILAFLLAFIVPKFQQIFKDMLGDKPLPAITQFVIGASDIMKNDILYVIGVIVATIIIFKMIVRTTRGRFLFDRVKLKMPLFGDLIRKSSISRFSRTLGTLVTSGVPILQALNITRETAGNAVIADAINKVHDSVKEGESIVHPLEASGVFPPMVISMIDVGEETGQLPEMLLKIAEVYDDEVDNAVTGLTSLLEPIMIVFLALIVGTIVIALFMPLISIITGMQAQGSNG
jgi:type IV pilus assembly protein PilC